MDLRTNQCNGRTLSYEQYMNIYLRDSLKEAGIEFPSIISRELPFLVLNKEIEDCESKFSVDNNNKVEYCGSKELGIDLSPVWSDEKQHGTVGEWPTKCTEGDSAVKERQEFAACDINFVVLYESVDKELVDRVIQERIDKGRCDSGVADGLIKENVDKEKQKYANISNKDGMMTKMLTRMVGSNWKTLFDLGK